MAEMVKKATRESFGETVTALAAEYPEIVVLDADLAAATKTGIFKKAYPERFFDCGIAECNMVGVAAGLATCGKIPFAASFAMFSAGRAFEQVRNSVGYPKLNVKIVGSHAGISVGEDGATHQCCEDIALMRTIPGMVILNPCDHYEMQAAVRAAVEHKGPCYIRLGRLAVESINNNDDYKFELGKGITLRIEGEPAAVSGQRRTLEQMIFNLTDNAINYNKPQGSVTLTTGTENGRPFVQVADTGIGIAPEELPRVKDRFYKGKSSRRGSGIGLAVADEIINMHGGSLKLTSRKGEGTTVTITLPLARG